MERKKGLFLSVSCLLLILLASGTAMGAQGGGNAERTGIPLYAIVELKWDAEWGYDKADEYRWGPRWAPQIGGELIRYEPNWIELPQDFRFIANGAAVHFVDCSIWETATPPCRRVTLHDFDGDGTYTGSVPFWRTGTSPGAMYFDLWEYELDFDEDGNLLHFYKCKYAYKKLMP